MNRLQIMQRVRALTRDFSNSIFREQDIIDFLNEGINRFVQIIPEFSTLTSLDSSQSSPTLIPAQYHHLLAVYSASRCFAQDERNYQATTLMNEFETKLDELKTKIENGEIVITDSNGVPVSSDYDTDFVETESYFGKRGENYTLYDVDLGVEGVE